jgi:TatD DNase family protein
MYFVDCHSHHLNAESDTIQVLNVMGDDERAKVASDYAGSLSFGYHPWFIGDVPDWKKMRDRLGAAAAMGNVVAIGECGLDKLRGPLWQWQEQAFRLHVDVSERFHKPLIIHCVKAFNEMVTLRKELSPSQPWILHGFTGNQQMVAQAFGAGFCFSLDLRHLEAFCRLVPAIPLDRLFFETDDTRGSVRDVYLAAAELLGIDVDELKQIVWKNYCNVFNC